MFSDKTIFISALDWGLGHSTRCVPLIRELKKNNRIIIGVTPITRPVFEEEFPTLEKINVPAYDIKYSSFLPLWLKLLTDWRRISSVIKKENTLLDNIIEKYKIDVVISDNRFGLHSKKTHCIFVTHQLFLKTPFANAVAQHINRKYILNFDEVWVPDYEDALQSLNGGLSHGKHFHKNIKYIGPKSRLTKTNPAEKKYDYLVLISGPEPQSTKLKNMLLHKIAGFPDLKFALVSPSGTKINADNMDVFIAPTNQQLSEIICASEKIICRSGYSTLMDLHQLDKKKLVLIPTPGQTEQEYLAEYWHKKYFSETCKQNNIKALQL